MVKLPKFNGRCFGINRTVGLNASRPVALGHDLPIFYIYHTGTGGLNTHHQIHVLDGIEMRDDGVGFCHDDVARRRRHRRTHF